MYRKLHLFPRNTHTHYTYIRPTFLWMRKMFTFIYLECVYQSTAVDIKDISKCLARSIFILSINQVHIRNSLYLTENSRKCTYSWNRRQFLGVREVLPNRTLVKPNRNPGKLKLVQIYMVYGVHGNTCSNPLFGKQFQAWVFIIL